MSDVPWLAATVEEARRHLTLILVIGLALAAVVRSRVSSTRRTRAGVRGTGIVLGLHLASLPLLGYMAVRASPHYRQVELVSMVLATVVGINIGLVLVFDGLLQWMKVEAPRILSDVVGAAAFVVAALILLSRWGVNLSGIIATSAVLTAVIGFSMQDTLGNLMGGLALQIEKSLRPGDWIEVDGMVGRVRDVRWRQTSIETRNWETIVIPNSMLSKNKFKVLGRRAGEPVQLRRWIYFNVDYRTAPADVIRACEDALRQAPIAHVADRPSPNCVLMDMQNSFNHYAVRYWLTDLQFDDPTDSVVRTRVFTALRRANIPLTMPAQAIFLTNETEERKDRKASLRVMDRKSALQSVDLFESLSEPELDELAAALSYAPFAAGEELTRQGAAGSDLYLISRGRVAVRVSVGGVEHQVAQLEPGAFFGERSLMTGEPRSATTVALGEVVCYRLSKEALASILEGRPEVAEEIAEVLARREAEIDSLRRDLDERDHIDQIDRNRRQFVAKIRAFFGLRRGKG